MRKSCRWIAPVLFLIALAQPLWAKDKNTVAVLPFSVHSAENIDYVRQGIEGFTADVIADNKAMLKVFEKAPFPIRAVMEFGIYNLNIPFALNPG